MPEKLQFEQVVEDLRQFFTSSDHWAYQKGGTPSSISPQSVYHITQLEVLLEDRHFHDRTYRAFQQLRAEGFLKTRDINVMGSRSTLVWRSTMRYVERAIQAHSDLMSEYMSPIITKATGDYAETLVLLGLSRLNMRLAGRNTASYRGKTWTESENDLDFVMESNGVGYGVEVKNTLDYFPDDELLTKLRMCKYLGIVPLFVARNRHSIQWQATRSHGGMLYIFKSKIFPPGQDDLVHRLWMDMRLPVTIWTDWPGQFYPVIERFLAETGNTSS